MQRSPSPRRQRLWAMVCSVVLGAGCQTTSPKPQPAPPSTTSTPKPTTTPKPPPRAPSAEAYRLLALSEVHLAKGDLDGAIAKVKQARMSDHRSVYLAVHLARLQMEAGDLEDADKALSDALAKDPNHKRGLQLLARLRAYSGDTDEAQALLRRAMRAHPSDLDVVRQLLRLLLSVDDVEGAVKVVDASMKRDEGATFGYMVLAQQFASLGDVERSRTYAAHVLERDGRHKEALELMMRLSLADGDPTGARVWVDKWVREMGDGMSTRKRLLQVLRLADDDRAWALQKAWLDEDGSEDMARLVAEAFDEIGDTEVALTVLLGGDVDNGRVANVPEVPAPKMLSPKVRVDVGRLLLMMRQPEQAHPHLCAYDELTTSWAQWAHSLCVQALLDGGDVDAAAQRAKQGLAKWPNVTRVRSVALQVVERTGQPHPTFSDDDMQAWAQDAAATPDDADALELRLLVAALVGGDAEVRQVATAVLQRKRPSLAVANVLARRFSEIGDIGKVRALLLPFVERDEAGPSEFNFLAFSLADANVDVDLAADLAQRALVARPTAGYIVDTVGWTQFRQGHLQKAVATLRQANRLSPREPEILFHLASSLHAVGDDAAARRHLSSARSIAGAPPKLQKRMEALWLQLPSASSKGS